MTLSEHPTAKRIAATIVPTLEPTISRCTPGGAIAAGRRRVGRLLLGATLLMLVLAVVMSFGGRWGPAVVCVGAAFLAFLAWRMSGDLDPLWLTLEPGELMVQMRRQRASLLLQSVEARPLDAAERAHLASLTSSRRRHLRQCELRVAPARRVRLARDQPRPRRADRDRCATGPEGRGGSRALDRDAG